MQLLSHLSFTSAVLSPLIIVINSCFSTHGMQSRTTLATGVLNQLFYNIVSGNHKQKLTLLIP